MNSIEITEETAEALVFQELPEDSPYTEVEEIEWQDDGKYSCGRMIFEFEGHFFELCANRTGSYYTEFTYGFGLDCSEVESREVTSTTWLVKE